MKGEKFGEHGKPTKTKQHSIIFPEFTEKDVNAQKKKKNLCVNIHQNDMGKYRCGAGVGTGRRRDLSKGTSTFL